MAGALGDLVIALHADTARFESDMGRAARISEQQWNRIADRADFAIKAIAAGALLAGAAALKMGADFISAAADLDDMAEKTGASVEELSKLSQQAYISGQSMETVETGLIKLSKALHENDEDAKKGAKALGALGLSAEQLRGLDTAQALRIVSTELAKFADGSGKTALALDLFGKSGAQLLPILKDMANDGALNASVTAKQAAEAEELQKSWKRLSNEALVAKQAIALDLIPTLQNLVTQLRITKEIGNGSFFKGLATFLSVSGSDPVQELNEVRKGLERLKQTRDDYAKMSPLKQWFEGDNIRIVNAQIGSAEKRLTFLTKLAESQGERDNFDPSFMKSLPKLDYAQSAKAAKDYSKQIEDLKRLYDEVKQLGQSIDVTVMPPTFKPENLDREKRDMQSLKKTLDESVKGWVKLAETVFDESEAQDKANASGESFTQTAEKTRDRLRDLIDPLQAIAKEHQLIDVLVSSGWMTEMEARLAKLPSAVRELLQPITNIHNEIQKAWEAGLLTDEQMEQALLRTQQHLEKTDDFAKSLGLTFESAFEKAIGGGMKFSGVLKGLASDITRMLTRKYVTEPIGNAIGGGSFGGILGAFAKALGSGPPTGTATVSESMIADLWSGSYATGTDYVPKTGLAMVHKGEAIVPADENARGRAMTVYMTVNTPNADSFRASRRQIMSELTGAF